MNRVWNVIGWPCLNSHSHNKCKDCAPEAWYLCAAKAFLLTALWLWIAAVIFRKLTGLNLIGTKLYNVLQIAKLHSFYSGNGNWMWWNLVLKMKKEKCLVWLWLMLLLTRFLSGFSLNRRHNFFTVMGTKKCNLYSFKLSFLFISS